EDAPTTVFDAPRDDLGPAEAGATVDERSDPWTAIGLALPPALARHYRLVRVLAHGGVVEAYLARHAFLGHKVLLKTVARSAVGGLDARAFLAEATALWKLSHPGFPAVLEYGTDLVGRPFAIMEYATGVT